MEWIKFEYLCNGLRHDLPEAEFLKILQEFKGRFSDEDFGELSGETYERPLTVGPVTKGNRTLLFLRWDSGVAVRQYCGADLAELIAEIPEDGEVHEVACPQCSTKTTVRKPGAPDLPETDRILGGTAA